MLNWTVISPAFSFTPHAVFSCKILAPRVDLKSGYTTGKLRCYHSTYNSVLPSTITRIGFLKKTKRLHYSICTVQVFH